MNAVVRALTNSDPVLRMQTHLLGAAADLPNADVLARIIAAQRVGNSCLPLHLGLDLNTFSAMMQRYFPGTLFWLALHSGHEEAFRRGALRQQLLEMRCDEWGDVRDLLLNGRRGEDASEIWLAAIVAAGCLGGDHLWRDLGLATRADLGQLLRHNFPGIALRNDRDMKWKKFFYRQLCETQGHFVCRSPSCEQCAAFSDCFGAEE
jgi:nitrogen fixation protein NifQ